MAATKSRTRSTRKDSGVCIYPVFERRTPRIDFREDGKILATEFQALDALAVEIGVALFSSFGDNLPGNQPANDWHSPADGLECVSALLRQLTSNRERFEYLEFLEFELRDLERCLREAEGADVRFRLEMS